MEVKNVDNKISFGYKTLLKDLWMKGELPTVKYGLYRKKLTKKNCSNEHLIPHSLGGPTNPSNIALADKFINNARGNSDIRLFLTIDDIKQYLLQFVDVIVKKNNKIIFSGNEYIKGIIPTFKKLGFKFDDKKARIDMYL